MSEMSAFVARLMSLSAHELQLLNSDCDLMRQFSETQLMVESRLHELTWRAKLAGQSVPQMQFQFQQQQQQQQQHYQSSPYATNQSGNQQQQQQQQQQLYQDYYTRAAQFAVAQHQQQQHHHQLHLLATVSQQQQLQLQQQQQQQQQQQHHQPQSTASQTSSPSHQQQQSSPTGSLLTQHQAQLALDLRTSSAGSAHPSDQQQQPTQRRPAGNQGNRSNAKRAKLTPSSSPHKSTNQTSAQAVQKQFKDNNGHQNNDKNINISISSADPADLLESAHTQQVVLPNGGGCGKKYKGEFDEPSAAEVDKRVKILAKQDNYHRRLADKCACVLGSEFRDRPVGAVLEMIEKWRSNETESRIKAKWDVDDLPKDIPLSEIKKFEDLRREVSNGRADFGGASKRKPLGIRGTRQFLMILYCLWGHPGRDDEMQREGYCPHCFAKIKKSNEQSTLVRVVNHFNMKHRKGANPRLSPHSKSSDRESPLAPQVASSPISLSPSSTSSPALETATAAITTTSSAAAVNAADSASENIENTNCNPLDQLAMSAEVPLQSTQQQHQSAAPLSANNTITSTTINTTTTTTNTTTGNRNSPSPVASA